VKDDAVRLDKKPASPGSLVFQLTPNGHVEVEEFLAATADEMVMRLEVTVVPVTSAAEVNGSQLALRHENVQIPVDGPQRKARIPLLESGVNRLGRRMLLALAHQTQDRFPLA